MNTLPDWCRNLPALSVRQPWAWLILHGKKDIENRSRRSHYRGHFLIHASLGCTQKEWDRADTFSALCCGRMLGDIPPIEQLPRGGIVGVARLVGCVTQTASPWFVGPFGYVLEDVQPLPFVPCKGALGFFKPSFASQ